MEAIKRIEFKDSLNKTQFISLLNSKGVKIEQDLLQDKNLFESAKNYFALNYLPEFVETPKDELDMFYGKYYWLSILIGRYKKLFGNDEGLDQQLFKLCEEAENLGLDVDWNLVERIEENIKNKSTL